MWPSRYDFRDMLQMSSLTEMADYFVRRYTQFRSLRDYLGAYTLVGDTLLVLMNAHHEAIDFALPGGAGERWDALIDTHFPDGLPEVRAHPAGAGYPLQGRSAVLLSRPSASGPARTDG